jgi:hypothetical protein
VCVFPGVNLTNFVSSFIYLFFWEKKIHQTFDITKLKKLKTLLIYLQPEKRFSHGEFVSFLDFSIKKMI